MIELLVVMAGKSSLIPRLISSLRVLNIGLRRLSVSSVNLSEQKLRVLPISHQLASDHNKQYFTPYPFLTKEDLEEPPLPLDDEVIELLKKTRGRWEGLEYILPELDPKDKEFKVRRKELIAAGHYFPVLPMEDLMLDPMPELPDVVVKMENLAKNIEENMKMMPQWINEHKE